jgi:hypothetical protein
MVAFTPHAVSDALDAVLVASMRSKDSHIPIVTVRTTVNGLPTGEVAGASIFSTASTTD